MAMVDAQRASLAQCAPFSPNGRDARPPLVVAGSGHPFDRHIRFAGEREPRRLVGVHFSIPGRAARVVPWQRTRHAGSQGSFSRGVGHRRALRVQRAVQYVLGRRTPVSWLVVAPHGWRVCKRGLGGEWTLVWCVPSSPTMGHLKFNHPWSVVVRVAEPILAQCLVRNHGPFRAEHILCGPDATAHPGIGLEWQANLAYSRHATSIWRNSAGGRSKSTRSRPDRRRMAPLTHTMLGRLRLT